MRGKTGINPSGQAPTTEISTVIVTEVLEEMEKLSEAKLQNTIPPPTPEGRTEEVSFSLEIQSKDAHVDNRNRIRFAGPKANIFCVKKM